MSAYLKPKDVLFSVSEDDGDVHLCCGLVSVRVSESANEFKKFSEEMKNQLDAIQKELEENNYCD